ncbi:hypothetical protein GCM10011362_05260 [Marinobacter halophilus]|uniref:Uncharacterized protein n=1 Tax=Marinobacter halophilus TaxID=1323740 RepID=A0A2T1KDZ0_9GAMM|nr:hypothetical protein C7H08_06515 [Marinobacter halophilus]GGC59784.1 hypothetical protein GCM10011362_05260 [Marinobacter halophilus]
MAIVRDDKPARMLVQGRELQGTGSCPKDQGYRDDCKDDVLRMMRSLMDQAGVSHGISGLHGS